MNGELLRIVDAIRREKDIDVEIVFAGIEAAMISAAKKHFGAACDISVSVDRESGNISATLDSEPITTAALGRIAAQTAKQVIIQKIREAEREVIVENYSARAGSIVSGQVSRIEHGNVIVNLSKVEGLLPRSEQIPGETHHVASRIRCLILDVRQTGGGVKVILSRAHIDFIKQLFELEVPEIADHTIEIRVIAREPGHRTKIAVSSIDSRVDCVGACVGVRGTRIKNIVEEVGGEKIDIVRWNESPQVFIGNSLKPAEVVETFLFRNLGRAVVLVNEDQLSLAIGKKGQNVRLAARLSNLNIDIMTPAEFDQQRTDAVELLGQLESVGPELATGIVEAGLISVADVTDADPATLADVEGIDQEQAKAILQEAKELLVTLEARAAEAAKAEKEAREQAAKDAEGEAAEGETAEGETAEGETAEDEAAETKAEVTAENEAVAEEAETPATEGEQDAEEPAERTDAQDEPDAQDASVAVSEETQSSEPAPEEEQEEPASAEEPPKA